MTSISEWKIDCGIWELHLQRLRWDIISRSQFSLLVILEWLFIGCYFFDGVDTWDFLHERRIAYGSWQDSYDHYGNWDLIVASVYCGFNLSSRNMWDHYNIGIIKALFICSFYAVSANMRLSMIVITLMDYKWQCLLEVLSAACCRRCSFLLSGTALRMAMETMALCCYYLLWSIQAYSSTQELNWLLETVTVTWCQQSQSVSSIEWVNQDIYEDDDYFSRPRRPWIYFMDISHVPALIIDYYGVNMEWTLESRCLCYDSAQRCCIGGYRCIVLFGSNMISEHIKYTSKSTGECFLWQFFVYAALFDGMIFWWEWF